MADTEKALLAYIQKEADKGFDEPAIRKALTKVGYPEKTIDSVYAAFNSQKEERSEEENKPEEVKEETTEDNKIEEVETEKPIEVKEKSNEPTTSNSKPSNLRNIIIIVALIILIGGGTFAYFSFFQTTDSMGETSDNSQVGKKTPVKNSLPKLSGPDAISFCKGLTTYNTSACKLIDDINQEGNCLYYLSILKSFEKGGSTICYSNSNAAHKSLCLYTAKKQTEKCRQHCDVVNANLARDAAACPADKPYCSEALNLWNAKTDISICNEFSDKKKKQICEFIANDNSDSCEELR